MDYIGKHVKRFESGSIGSLALSQCGNDWGLSCGSYQLTLRWGNCIKFLTKYFPTESKGLYFNPPKDVVSDRWPGAGYCSSPDDVKTVWLKCYNTYGAEKFFEYEHAYMKDNFYEPIRKKILGYIDLNKTSRALQECFWSWSIHRGPGGAYNEFIAAIKGINLKTISHEVLFDILYDMRYKQCAFTRYARNAGASSERESLRSYIDVPGLGVKNITSPSPLQQNNIIGGLTMKYTNSNPPLQCMMKNSTCYKSTRQMKVLGILWHSTGCNNPNLKRYVQPHESDSNYNEMIALIGKNNYNNDWNHINHQAGLNAWIGKLADGSVTTLQTMPWTYRPWGCGSGKNGSCNNGWIQFEICEDGLTDANYFNKVYKEACELTAYLCKLYNINPHGTVKVNGVQVPTITCHADAHALGMGSNHGDINHWFPKFGKSMTTVRNDVAELLHSEEIIPVTPAPPAVTPTPPVQKEEEEMTQEKFNEMMNNYLVSLALKNPSDWSKEAREWCEANGIIKGDEHGNKMYKKYMTREEIATVLYRLHGQK